MHGGAAGGMCLEDLAASSLLMLFYLMTVMDMMVERLT